MYIIIIIIKQLGQHGKRLFAMVMQLMLQLRVVGVMSDKLANAGSSCCWSSGLAGVKADTFGVQSHPHTPHTHTPCRRERELSFKRILSC